MYHRLANLLFALLILGGIFTARAANAAQAFKFEDFFFGKTVAYGKFSAVNGVRRSFKVDLNGTWNGKTLRLVERFKFNDGGRETKVWTFTKTGNGKYIGKSAGMQGVANVQIKGNTARYAYTIFLDVPNKKTSSNLKTRWFC